VALARRSAFLFAAIAGFRAGADRLDLPQGRTWVRPIGAFDLDFPDAGPSWIADDGRVALSSAVRWQDWTGMEVASVIDGRWLEAVHPDERDGVRQAWSDSLASGRSTTASSGCCSRRRYRWMRARAFPQRDDDGPDHRWAGVLEDIHEQRLAEEQLRQTAGLLEMIGSSTDSIIWAKDRDGRMLYINARWSGWRDHAGRHARQDRRRMEPQPGSRSASASCRSAGARSGTADDCRGSLHRPDGGAPLPLDPEPASRPVGEVIGSVGVATDITERARPSSARNCSPASSTIVPRTCWPWCSRWCR
jgi:PAS domain S-box-containing protein